ncbi:MAG: hypothetical protein CMJ78_24365 [Planctomycetaceae bacterium]|nr:hypothetical protein [Planctomycetaceae bacterium]
MQAITAIAIFSAGYFFGTQDIAAPKRLTAQDGADALSKDATDRIREAMTALSTAREVLEAEGRYTAVTKGVNCFAISVGGVDARADLEKNRGVDPETFAALYAGMAADDVADQLDKDEQGRLTYNGRVVRLYPISRLNALYKERLKFDGTAEDTGF